MNTIVQVPSEGVTYYCSPGGCSANEADVSYLPATTGFTTLQGSGFGAIKYTTVNLTCTITAPGVGRGWDICLRKSGACSALGFSIYNTSTNATDNVYKDSFGVLGTWAIAFTPINNPAAIKKGSCNFEIDYAISTPPGP